MKPLLSIPLLLAAALPAALSAESWKEVDRLTGDIAVELDQDSVAKAQDGTREVLLGTFRKELPNAMMQTNVAVDCATAEAKIRGIRLMLGEKVATDNPTPGAEFLPVNYGSSEAIYFKALCGKEIAEPAGVEEARQAAAGAAAEAASENETQGDGAE